MDIIGKIFSALKDRFASFGLFSKVFGLVELGSDGKYRSYEGGGQGVFVQNFDNDNGTIFFLMRGIPSIVKKVDGNLVACSPMYSMTLPIRAIGVLRKGELPCDNATAGFQIAQGMLGELFGFDAGLRKAINVSSLEVVPVAIGDSLRGMDINNEYAVGVVDFNIVLFTNLKCLPQLCAVD